MLPYQDQKLSTFESNCDKSSSQVAKLLKKDLKDIHLCIFGLPLPRIADCDGFMFRHQDVATHSNDKECEAGASGLLTARQKLVELFVSHLRSQKELGGLGCFWHTLVGPEWSAA